MVYNNDDEEFMELFSKPGGNGRKLARRVRMSDLSVFEELATRYAQALYETDVSVNPQEVQVGESIYDTYDNEYVVVENDSASPDTVLMPKEDLQMGGEIPTGIKSIPDYELSGQFTVQPTSGVSARRQAVIKKLDEKDKDPDKPADKQLWGLYTHDGKKLLGRHPTRESAEEQEKAVQVNKQGNAMNILPEFIKVRKAQEFQAGEEWEDLEIEARDLLASIKEKDVNSVLYLLNILNDLAFRVLTGESLSDDDIMKNVSLEAFKKNSLRTRVLNIK